MYVTVLYLRLSDLEVDMFYQGSVLRLRTLPFSAGFRRVPIMDGWGGGTSRNNELPKRYLVYFKISV